jgi:hypothetical protein
MESYNKAMLDKDPSWKPKQKKDSSEKKPSSGFQLYSKSVREQVKKDKPELSGSDISKEIGNRWKKIKDKPEGKKFLDEAKALKKKYDDEHGVAEKKEKKGKSKKAEKEVEEDEVDAEEDDE